jgi:beta-RFAP synthase
LGTAESVPVVRVRTGSRLHFGLLAMHPELPRRFGGVGLMVERPGVELTLSYVERAVAPAAKESAGKAGPADVAGPLAGRALDFAGRVAAAMAEEGGSRFAPFRIRIERAAPEHAGLGTGTQLGLAVAAAVAAHAGRRDLTAVELGERAGRGLRSAVGLHGFAWGGLLVEAGKREGEEISPLVSRVEFPADWRVVLIIPRALRGLHGRAEEQAFRDLPPVPVETTRRLCETVLLRLLPAALERRLDEFGEALYELQQAVGTYFKPAQGGVYADPRLEQMVNFLRGAGIRGVGQSSWGPTLYAVTSGDADARAAAEAVRKTFALGEDEVLITAGRNQGAEIC